MYGGTEYKSSSMYDAIGKVGKQFKMLLKYRKNDQSRLGLAKHVIKKRTTVQNNYKDTLKKQQYVPALNSWDLDCDANKIAFATNVKRSMCGLLVMEANDIRKSSLGRLRRPVRQQAVTAASLPCETFPEGAG